MEIGAFIIPYALVYAFAWWFGLYLLARDWSKPGIRYTGLGLTAYALGLALDLLAAYTSSDQDVAILIRLRGSLLLLPIIFWFGATFYLLPEGHDLRVRLGVPLSRSLPLAACAIFVFSYAAGSGILGVMLQWLIIIALGVLVVATWMAAGQALRAGIPRRPLAIFSAATLFFGLGMAVLVVSSAAIPNQTFVLAIGVDLALLGLAVALLDAFEEGERFAPDFLRSLTLSAFVTLIFGGQVALVMAISGVTLPLLLLLLLVIGSGLAIQVFSDAIQGAADRLVFARLGRMRHARAELRATASALPRANPALDPDEMDEAEFARLTRRALSHFGDLHRLAASPLTRLALIDARLTARGQVDSSIERAVELRELLASSVARLKPRGEAHFGVSEEWRYYNVLYFPYILGLKPYSRSLDHDDLEPAAQAALDWFRTSVPERTLYNWQTAAAKLVARDLRERRAAPSKDPEMSVSQPHHH